MSRDGILLFDEATWHQGVEQRKLQLLWSTGRNVLASNCRVDQYKAFPSFMKNYLQNPSDSVVHIVTKDRS